MQPLNVPPLEADPPAAGGGGAGDANQHQDRLERQMLRARQRLQARADSLDRLRQRQRELLYPNLGGPPIAGLVSSAEMKTRRQNEMKKWSDENKSKYTSKVESVETMKDKEPASKVRQQAEKTLEKLKIALKSINKSAKYFETKEFRELIEPYLKLQSRLQSVVNSLDFNALDKELPFSKQKSPTETVPTNPPLDREAQIAADREFALSMSRSLNEDHPNVSVGQAPPVIEFSPLWQQGLGGMDKTQRDKAQREHQARIKELTDKLNWGASGVEQERQERIRRKQTIDVSGPIIKKRKLSGEKPSSREKKVKNWLEKQRNELVEEMKASKTTKSKTSDATTETNAGIKTDPDRSTDPGNRLLLLPRVRAAPLVIQPPEVERNAAENTVKIEVGENQPIVVVDNQPIVVDPSDDDDVILSDIDFNMGPGPSGLNSKSGKNKK